MSARVTVVDYGMGNLLSVRRALERCGAEVEVADQGAAIARAERLVLPGVGAFAEGMAELRTRSLERPIVDFAASGRPFLGICLGMQMMFEVSNEHGEHAGLGLIPGRVVAIPAEDAGNRVRKIPHIGWATLVPAASGRSWNSTLLDQAIPGRTSAYFVHSYHVCTAMEQDALAACEYEGCTLVAVVAKGNLAGCQYHPEKSGEAGLAMIRSFLSRREQ